MGGITQPSHHAQVNATEVAELQEQLMLPAETPSVQSGVFREDRPTVRYPYHIPAAILLLSQTSAAILHPSQIFFRVAATPRISHMIGAAGAVDASG